mgnify:FL=1
MEPSLLIKLGKNGVVVIPDMLRELFHFEEGELVVVRAKEDGIFISTFKTYSNIKKPELLPENTTTHENYKEIYGF